MGKYVKDAFKVDDKKIIDYATSEFRSDFLDIFISAKCFFWITSGSGLDVTSIIFKKPVLNINRSPVSYIMAHQNFLCTTKHYFDVNLQKKLSFKEISKRSLDIEINSNILKKNKVELVENSSDEILQATKEFYSSLNNNFEFIDKRNELNEKIKNYIKYDENDFLDVNNKPIKNFQNYPFFSYNFLKQNPYLLK
jgi:putative glycosyltransferase (TIGR04372 family)